MSLMGKTFKSILLVEDNKAGRLIMREAFKMALVESQLHVVENGDDALRFLNQEDPFEKMPMPDLILLDLNLPGKSGVEVLAEIRKEVRFQAVAIMVLTGSSAASDIEACSKFHCRYFIKPARFHELVQLVKSLPEFC